MCQGHFQAGCRAAGTQAHVSKADRTVPPSGMSLRTASPTDAVVRPAVPERPCFPGRPATLDARCDSGAEARLAHERISGCLRGPRKVRQGPRAATARRLDNRSGSPGAPGLKESLDRFHTLPWCAQLVVTVCAAIALTDLVAEVARRIHAGTWRGYTESQSRDRGTPRTACASRPVHLCQAVQGRRLRRNVRDLLLAPARLRRCDQGLVVKAVEKLPRRFRRRSTAWPISSASPGSARSRAKASRHSPPIAFSSTKLSTNVASS